MEIQIIQIWVFSPLSQFKLASQLTRDLILPVCIILYFYDLIINPAYFGHYDPSDGKPPGPFVFFMNTRIAYYDTWNKIDIDMADPRKISLARWQQIIISVLLSYYMALQGPKYGIIHGSFLIYQPP